LLAYLSRGRSGDGSRQVHHLYLGCQAGFWKGGGALEGSYSLWLRKWAITFELVFNKQVGQWESQYSGSIDDVAAVPLTFSEGSEAVEMFTVSLTRGAKANAGELTLQWGKAVLKAPFTVK
jgi:hypothetical protein